MYLLRICFARGKHVRSKCEANMKQLQLCCSDVVRLCLPRGAVLALQATVLEPVPASEYDVKLQASPKLHNCAI